MGWGAAAFAILSAVTKASEASAQRAAAKDQERLAEETRSIAERNAVREEQETLESTRRMAEVQKKQEAQSRAMSAASNLETSGFAPDDASSIALALAEQRTENLRQLDWEKFAGASRADMIRKTGDVNKAKALAESKAMKRSARASLIGAAAMGGKGAALGYDWWSPPSDIGE